MPPIRGHNILVIGGSSGIGAAVAQLAAAEGLRVSIASSNPSRVAKAVEKIRAAVPGAMVSGHTCDVNDDDAESNLEKLFADVTAATGALLDHVVYTSNAHNMRPVADVSVSYLRSSTQFAFVVPFLIAKLALRYVSQTPRSSVTLTTGQLAERPAPGLSVGSGWAAGLYGITRGLALDIAPVRVNLVSPGITDTEMLGVGERREQMLAMGVGSSPLSKVGTPEEVAEAYVYLMKDTNNTGTCVHTNGGASVK